MKAKIVTRGLIAGYIALGIWLAGCASAQRKQSAPSGAFVAAEAARLQVAKARVAVEKVSFPADARAVDAVKTALEKADAALAEAGSKIEGLQAEMATVSAAKEQADCLAERQGQKAAFWRACAWKLALLSLALGVWTLRKPLLILCGGPVL